MANVLDKDAVASRPLSPLIESPSQPIPIPKTSTSQVGISRQRQAMQQKPYMPIRPHRPRQDPVPKMTPIRPRQEGTRPPKMSLTGLPRFHPLNFSHNDTSNGQVPPQTRAPLLHPSTSHPTRSGNYDTSAHFKLQQYQRQLIENMSRDAAAAKMSSLNMHEAPASSTEEHPDSPRLAPLASPSDLMTPLELEGQLDYLTAGSGLSPRARTQSSRGLVDMLLQQENDRRTGALGSNISSPAVSPAGGP